MNEALQLPGRLQCLDDADQGAHRHADHRRAHAGRASRSTAPTSARSSGSARRSSGCCRRCPARAACSPSAPSGGYFLDFDWKRDELARYGLSIDDAQMVVMSAIGGDNVTTTVEGRERYPVNVRYFRDYRSDLDRLRRVLVPAMDGRMQIPVGQLADREARQRSGDAAQRERPADRLRLRRRRRPRHRQLRGRGQAAWSREHVKLPPGTRWPGAGSTRRWSASASA